MVDVQGAGSAAGGNCSTEDILQGATFEGGINPSLVEYDTPVRPL
jgi:hypothetical protein